MYVIFATKGPELFNSLGTDTLDPLFEKAACWIINDLQEHISAYAALGNYALPNNTNLTIIEVITDNAENKTLLYVDEQLPNLIYTGEDEILSTGFDKIIAQFDDCIVPSQLDYSVIPLPRIAVENFFYLQRFFNLFSRSDYIINDCSFSTSTGVEIGTTYIYFNEPFDNFEKQVMVFDKALSLAKKFISGLTDSIINAHTNDTTH